MVKMLHFVLCLFYHNSKKRKENFIYFFISDNVNFLRLHIKQRFNNCMEKTQVRKEVYKIFLGILIQILSPAARKMWNKFLHESYLTRALCKLQDISAPSWLGVKKKGDRMAEW